MNPLLSYSIVFSTLALVLIIGTAHHSNDEIAVNPDGQKIYEVYCQICHGKDGTRVLTGYYDLAESSLESEEIKKVILKGRNAMYAYEAILNSEEVEAVTDYVLSLRPGR